MKKSFKKIAITVMAAMLVLCGCSYFPTLDNYKKLREVKPEVSYGYTVVGDYSVSIDCCVYTYKSLVQNTIGKNYSLSPYKQTVLNNKLYFLYEYDRRGSWADDKNTFKFDVGLFCVDVETVACELIYKFENVYPTDIDTSYDPYLGKIFDGNRMLVEYNGQLQILNLQTKQIVYSTDVYDKEEYVDKDSWVFPYYFSSAFGDYKGIVDGNKLRYYELKDYEYVLHEYDAEVDVTRTAPYIRRVDNYVYTYVYDNDARTYTNCFDITTDEAVEIDELLRVLEENKKPSASEPPEQDKDIYEIGGTRYKIENSDGVQISDENGNLIQTIDKDYMKNNSKPFNDLYYICSKKVYGYHATGFNIVDGKLFIGFSASYPGFLDDYDTPIYIYEYSIAEDKIYYVGFSESGLSDLRLH